MEIKSMRFRAQNLEDGLALEYFSGKGYTIKDLTYLSLGENNGITISNTYIFAQLGCSGLAVEPSPKAFAQLQENYKSLPNVELLNVAVGNIDGTMPFYESGEHLGQGDVSLLSSLRKEETERWKKETFEKIEVPVVTVSTLLQMCSLKTFDYISIDCEGEDESIASQLDFNALQTKLVIVEWNSKDLDKFNKIFYDQGFVLYHKNAENILYVK